MCLLFDLEEFLLYLPERSQVGMSRRLNGSTDATCNLWKSWDVNKARFIRKNDWLRRKDSWEISILFCDEWTHFVIYRSNLSTLSPDFHPEMLVWIPWSLHISPIHTMVILFLRLQAHVDVRAWCGYFVVKPFFTLCFSIECEWSHSCHSLF